ncbi:copia protein [Tanacetum coccineum]
MKIKESLNVTFGETPPPSKTSPLVDDELDKAQAIKIAKKKNIENDIENETLEVDEIVNIKESKNHPLENVIGNLNQRTLRFKLFQMDVESAFPNGFINEEVYVAQPLRFFDFEKPNNVYKLKKALYGLKQDPKACVCLCARFQEAPKTSHIEAVKRIFRYIKGNTHLGLWYPDEVFCIWKAFGRNTRDLGSFGEETNKTTNLHQHLSRISTQKLETASQITRDAVTTHLKTASQDLQTAIKRYIDTKPNSELIHYCLQNPPYTYQWAEKTVPVAEGSSETTTKRKSYKTYQQQPLELHQTPVELINIILQESTEALGNMGNVFPGMFRTKTVKDVAYSQGKAVIVATRGSWVQLKCRTSDWRHDIDDE